jgi:threonyl-tRNA synthetase
VSDGFELFTDRSVVAMRVNGELKDLATQVTTDDMVEPVTIDSPDGMNILRHSTASVHRSPMASITTSTSPSHSLQMTSKRLTKR